MRLFVAYSSQAGILVFWVDESQNSRTVFSVDVEDLTQAQWERGKTMFCLGNGLAETAFIMRVSINHKEQQYSTFNGSRCKSRFIL